MGNVGGPHPLMGSRSRSLLCSCSHRTNRCTTSPAARGAAPSPGPAHPYRRNKRCKFPAAGSFGTWVASVLLLPPSPACGTNCAMQLRDHVPLTPALDPSKAPAWAEAEQGGKNTSKWRPNGSVGHRDRAGWAPGCLPSGAAAQPWILFLVVS